MLRTTSSGRKLTVRDFKLNTLLEITNAINNNLSEEELFVLFEYILEHQLNIGKAIGFINQEGTWTNVIGFGVTDDELKVDVEKELKHIRDITVVAMTGETSDTSFDVVIPVFNQSEIIAYLMLGDLDENEIKASPIIKHLPFIQTLANITAVAVMNKYLLRESFRQERIERELKMAAQMQEMLLPEVLPNNDYIQSASLYKPHQEVGGDFYDIIEVSENEVFICMADVSGKGMSAAILMAAFQANLRANLTTNTDLKEIVERLNDRVWSNAHGERHITLFLAKYMRDKRILEYINAAHVAPLITHGNEVVYLKDGCVGLGMFEILPFIVCSKVKVEPMSTMLCFTDGVTELENEAEVPLPDDALAEVLLAEEFDSIGDVNDAVMKMLHSYRGKAEFHDDIALVSCRFI